MSATINPLHAQITGSQESTSLDRSKPPVLSAPKAVQLPPMTVKTLPNGLTIMVVERHQLPLVDFVLVVPGGASANPANRAGVADLMASMLLAGTSTRSSLEIDDQAAFLGVDLHVQSSWDATLVSLTTSVAQLDSALTLLSDVVLHPSFPVDEFERIQRERLTALLQLKDRGSAIAEQAYARIVYGPDHPYGRPVSGTEQSVGQMAVEDVKQFYKSHFVPNSSTLIAVGDITPEQLEHTVQRIFGGWERGTVVPTVIPEAPAAPPTKIYLIDKPGAPQSSFRLARPGVARSTSDYFPLQVMNTILGASFTSRLNMNLRETKGYTYGAGSRFNMRKGAGPFVAAAEIVGVMTDSALVEFLKELTGIRDTVPSDELGKAQQFLVLQLPGSFETTRDVAQQLAAVTLYNLPLDYYNHYSDNVTAVTQKTVQQVAQRYVDPAHLAIVIVGDLQVIEPKLRALNVAPIEIRNIDGSEKQ